MGLSNVEIAVIAAVVIILLFAGLMLIMFKSVADIHAFDEKQSEEYYKNDNENNG